MPTTRGMTCNTDDNTFGTIAGMTVTLSITVDDDLGRDLAIAVAGGNRSAVVATAIREYLDRRSIAAAAEWHASLTGEDAAALAEFDAIW
jgi:predicted transcriptional regulator